MPDNEQQSGPPALRPPSEPGAIDPEQVRQFQQFQQFQELMRQQGGAGPGTGPGQLPPARKPVWQRILGGKLVRRLILLAVVLATIPLWLPLAITGVAAVFSTPDDNRPASETGGGTYHTNHILKDSPYESVRQVYQRIADNSPAFACGVFTDEAAQQFAGHFNAADCPAAVAKLNLEVDKTPGSKNAYAEPDFHGKVGQVPSGNSIEVSSCELGVTAGPRLGLFVVSHAEGSQWIITGHRPETC